MTNIKYAVFGDVHLMHDRTPTAEIIKNFEEVFNGYKPGPLSQCNIIFNAGDLFDQIRDADDSDFLLSCAWINRFMLYCQQFNIKLRFLKGTPSHDGSQQEIARILSNNFPTLDFKYVDDIHIEYMPDLNIHVLYVPDECRINNRLIYEDVKQLMIEKGIHKVDIAIMHGAFAFQINFHSSTNRLHFEDDYLNIVKHFINIAHIHTPRVYERILGQGSFSRLSHGEEEDKGLMVMDIDTADPSKDRFTFIKNKGAKKYVTVRLTNNDEQKSWDRLNASVERLPAASYVRVLCKVDHPFYSGFNELRSKFSHLNMTKDKLDKKLVQQSENAFLLDENSYIPLQIDRNNIVDLIMERLDTGYNVNELLSIKSELEDLR